MLIFISHQLAARAKDAVVHAQTAVTAVVASAASLAVQINPSAIVLGARRIFTVSCSLLTRVYDRHLVHMYIYVNENMYAIVGARILLHLHNRKRPMCLFSLYLGACRCMLLPSCVVVWYNVFDALFI